MHTFYLLIGLFSISSVYGQESYTLEKVIQFTLENNFDIRIERNSALQISNSNNPGNAGYLPTVGVSADQNWSSNNTRQEFFSGQINEKNGAKNQSNSANIRLDWTFFDGFAMFARDNRLQLQEDQSTIQVLARAEMSVYQACIVFTTLLQQQKLLTVYQQANELSSNRLEITQLKFNNGAANQLQVLQAQLDVISDSSVLVKQKSEIQQLKLELCAIMGIAPSISISISGPTIPIENPNWEQIKSEMTTQNTSLLLAKSEHAILEMQRKEVQSRYYPQLSFNAQYQFTTSQNQVGILNSNRTVGPGVGISLRWSILDRLSKYTDLKNNTLLQENAQLIEQKQTQMLQSDVLQYQTEYEVAKSQFDLQNSIVLNAEESFSIANQSFEAGSMTALELREIQFAIVSAKSRQFESELMLQTALLNTRLLTGNFKKMIPF